MEEERSAGTGDSGDEDRNNPGTGDTERLSSMLAACSFMTEVGNVSLFRLLLVLITILSTPTIYFTLNGIWNAVSNNSFHALQYSTICELFVAVGFQLLGLAAFSSLKIRRTLQRNQ